MQSRDIFRTTREKLHPVFVIEQDANSPYFSRNPPASPERASPPKLSKEPTLTTSMH